MPEPVESEPVELKQLGGATFEVLETWRVTLFAAAQLLAHNVKDFSKKMQDILEPIRKSVHVLGDALVQLFDEDITTEEAFDVLQKIGPYIDAELDEYPFHPDEGAAVDLFIAAVRRARAAGVYVPRLKGEEKYVKLNPASHVMPNNLLMNDMQIPGLINNGAFDLPVIPAKGITAYTMVTLETDPQMVNLTEHERQVSDALVSLWAESERRKTDCVFTLNSVYETMPGGGDTASKKQEEAIAQTIEKFRQMRIYVDATEEAKARGYKIKSCVYDEYYFQIIRIQIQLGNGHNVTAYKLTSKPVIYKYAEMSKQLLTVSSKHLEIRKVKKGVISKELVPMTPERRSITGYMLRRIAIMRRGDKKQSNVILFDTIFEMAGIETKDRKQLMLYRNFCYEVLKYWKATGLICDYEEKKQGRKVTGVLIILNS